MQVHLTYQPFTGPVAGAPYASVAQPCPEMALLQRLQAREEQALLDFETQYGKELKALIRALVPDKNMAQDVWQECLLHLWQAFPQYEAGRGRLMAWARRICRNVAIDELVAVRWRDLQCTQSLELNEEVYARPALGGFQPDNLGLLDLCQQLRPQQRQVIGLLYGHDLTFEQTAQHLSLPVSTVKTRAQAAYRVLRRFVA